MDILHVRDGQVVRTTARDLPDTRYSRICAKGLSHVARIYSSKRVKYPMRRITGTERGTDAFERISWDEAAQEIADHYLQYIEESGPASNAFLVGSGNFGSVALKAADRFKAVIGGTLVNFSADLRCPVPGRGGHASLGCSGGYHSRARTYLRPGWPRHHVHDVRLRPLRERPLQLLAGLYARGLHRQHVQVRCRHRLDVLDGRGLREPRVRRRAGRRERQPRPGRRARPAAPARL